MKVNNIINAVQWALDTANDNTHGYSQLNRWGDDYDCSSFVISAWENAGVKVKEAGATYTGNMLSAFKKCGFKDVTKNVNLKTCSDLHIGDVLLRKGKHTEMYVGNGNLVGAHSDEVGGIKGKKRGDQTGQEISIKKYNPSYPWDYVLRPMTDDDFATEVEQLYNTLTVKTEEDKTTKIAREVIAGKWGNGAFRRQKLTQAGYNYKAIQTRVNELLRK